MFYRDWFQILLMITLKISHHIFKLVTFIFTLHDKRDLSYKSIKHLLDSILLLEAPTVDRR